MRKLVSLLGLVVVFAIFTPALHPTPAHAATSEPTYSTDNWKGIAELVKKLWLEAYMLLDRLMDGQRDGNSGGCCCGGGSCPCGSGGGTGGTGGGGTGGGGTGGGTGVPGDSP